MDTTTRNEKFLIKCGQRETTILKFNFFVDFPSNQYKWEYYTVEKNDVFNRIICSSMASSFSSVSFFNCTKNTTAKISTLVMLTLYHLTSPPPPQHTYTLPTLGHVRPLPVGHQCPPERKRGVTLTPPVYLGSWIIHHFFLHHTFVSDIPGKVCGPCMAHSSED